MVIKNGPHFSVAGLRPEILHVQPIVISVYELHSLPLVQWTSGTDRTHGRASLHYVGLAIDVWWDDGAWAIYEKLAVGNEIREYLGKGYDVVSENYHLHIEYQPKQGVNL